MCNGKPEMRGKLAMFDPHAWKNATLMCSGSDLCLFSLRSCRSFRLIGLRECLDLCLRTHLSIIVYLSRIDGQFRQRLTAVDGSVNYLMHLFMNSLNSLILFPRLRILVAQVGIFKSNSHVDPINTLSLLPICKMHVQK